MQKSPYKISGNKRRSLKKELSLIRLVLNNFWRNSQLDADMYIFFGTKGPSKESEKAIFNRLTLEVENLKSRLNELSSNT